MVETIFLDWMLSLGTGLLFGRIGLRAANVGEPRLRSRAFRAGALAQAALMTVSLTLYALSPSWMWMYWVNPSALPAGIVALAFVMYVVAFVAGFLVAPELERLRPGGAWVAIAGAAVGISVLELFAWSRLTHLGTNAAFAAGRAEGLHGSFLVAVVIGLPAVVLVVAGLLRSLSRAPATVS